MKYFLGFVFPFVLFTVFQQHAEHSRCPPEEDPASDSMRAGSRSHPSTELQKRRPESLDTAGSPTPSTAAASHSRSPVYCLRRSQCHVHEYVLKPGPLELVNLLQHAQRSLHLLPRRLLVPVEARSRTRRSPTPLPQERHPTVRTFLALLPLERPSPFSNATPHQVEPSSEVQDSQLAEPAARQTATCASVPDLPASLPRSTTCVDAYLAPRGQK